MDRSITLDGSLVALRQTNALFGTANGNRGGRVIQLALKLNF